MWEKVNDFGRPSFLQRSDGIPPWISGPPEADKSGWRGGFDPAPRGIVEVPEKQEAWCSATIPQQSCGHPANPSP